MKNLLFLFACTLIFSCSPKTAEKAMDPDLRNQADRLAHENIIVDGHVDFPSRLFGSDYLKDQTKTDVLIHSKEGDFDFDRARKGGLSAPFMSIYVSSSYQKTGGAKAYADSLIDLVTSMARVLPDRYALGRSPDEIEQNHRKGLISLPMGMENGAPIENDLRNVDYFFKRGIRYITLTHGKDNQICDSSYDTTATWKGLSPFGRQVVEEMNKTGIMIDISHVSDSAFYQVMRYSNVPCIASHSSCRHFTPTFQRNMSDDMIRLLAKNGGVIQINFGTSFLSDQLRNDNKDFEHKLDSLLKAKGLKEEDPEAKKVSEEFKKMHPYQYATVELVADHIDHAVKLAGIDHVGIGSDFDGVGDSLPEGLKDASQYPNLIYVLLKRCYSADDISKICYRNVFRVWRAVEEYARTH